MKTEGAEDEAFSFEFVGKDYDYSASFSESCATKTAHDMMGSEVR